ncbi:hypothetical protein J6590_029595 [Homalodisca vitripennis]|nr:hypothetical protein J6590_029595 [Homalodisca vitripennis]
MTNPPAVVHGHETVNLSPKCEQVVSNDSIGTESRLAKYQSALRKQQAFDCLTIKPISPAQHSVGGGNFFSPPTIDFLLESRWVTRHNILAPVPDPRGGVPRKHDVAAAPQTLESTL